MYKFMKKVWGYKQLFFGGVFSGFVIWRFNTIFDEYEKAITKENIYDVRKAKEQLNLYKELYDTQRTESSSSKPNKLLSMATEEDKMKMKQMFDQYDKMEDATEIKDQIAKLKHQIDMLDDKRTTHQGIKLTKIINGYEPSEEALRNIREYYKQGDVPNEESSDSK